MWELDKKTNMISKRLEHLRGWIQAAATLLTNIHLPNFFKGKIYQGNAKTVCVGTELLLLSGCHRCLPHRRVSGGSRIVPV